MLLPLEESVNKKTKVKLRNSKIELTDIEEEEDDDDDVAIEGPPLRDIAAR